MERGGLIRLKICLRSSVSVHLSNSVWPVTRDALVGRAVWSDGSVIPCKICAAAMGIAVQSDCSVLVGSAADVR